MAEEPLKMLKIHNVPFIDSGFEFYILLPRSLQGYREKGKPQDYLSMGRMNHDSKGKSTEKERKKKK
jgi:hypothetical protein